MSRLPPSLVHIDAILDAADDVLRDCDTQVKSRGALGSDLADILLDTRDHMVQTLAILNDGHPQLSGVWGAATRRDIARLRSYEDRATKLLQGTPGGDSLQVVGTVVAHPRAGSIPHVAECL